MVRALEEGRARLEGMLAGGAPGGIAGIISLYHGVMGVVSMCRALEIAGGGAGEVARARRLVSERFDADVHPAIVGRLEASVQEITGRLRPGGGDPVAGEPGLYEELREAMSTLEFARQYRAGSA